MHIEKGVVWFIWLCVVIKDFLSLFMVSDHRVSGTLFPFSYVQSFSMYFSTSLTFNDNLDLHLVYSFTLAMHTICYDIIGYS